MKVVSFINEKGGTCKTTFAVNLAAFFALSMKKRVLLVDMDSQGHAGKTLGINVRSVTHTIYDLLLDSNLKLGEVVLPTRIENLHLVPANKRLADFPQDVARLRDRELLFSRVVQQAKADGYDLMFVDSPPTLGLATINILIATTDVVVPVSLTYLSLDGCAEIVETMRTVRTNYPVAACRLAMVVPAMYRKTKLADQIIVSLKNHFPRELSKVIVGMSVKIDEAQSHGLTIWEYDGNSTGAKMLKALALELNKKIMAKDR